MIAKQNEYFSLFCVLAIVQIATPYQPYKHTDPDFAASVHHLKLLVLSELDILTSVFHGFITKISSESQASVVTNYIKDFESSIVAPLNPALSLEKFVLFLNNGYINKTDLADEIIKHPLKSYRCIRRFVLFINKFSESLKNEEIINMLMRVRKMLKFPKQSDLEAAMQNILRLRQIFTLSMTDLIDGTLGGMSTKSGLEISHLLEIAEHSVTLKMFSHAVDLFDGILQRCNEKFRKKPDMCSEISIANIKNRLMDVIKEHDEILVGNQYDGSDLDLVPPDSSPYLFDMPLISLNSGNFTNRRKVQIDLEFEAFMKLSNHSKLELDMAASPFLYEKVCRGDLLQKPSTNLSHHRCAYIHHTHPYYVIGPLKMEIHSEAPFIVQIYEVISNNEIKKLQEEVQQEMRQSRTTPTDESVDTESGKLSRFRTSANAWIEDNFIDAFHYLNERISLITGFNTTGYYSSEMVQIAAYNPGGHYTPHSDAMFEDTVLKWLPESELQRGDRIMTFMLYLSDVEKGGGTAFTTLRTLIHPVKGSAVAWYNLHSDGSINYDVLHGGCPVLYGTKWIANKWIRSNDQIFLRPCPPNREPWKLANFLNSQTQISMAK